MLFCVLLLVDGDDVRMLLMTWGSANKVANACGTCCLWISRETNSPTECQDIKKLWELELGQYIVIWHANMDVTLEIRNKHRNTIRDSTYVQIHTYARTLCSKPFLTLRHG